MFGTTAGGENPRPGEQSKTWHRFRIEDLREFRATEGSTEHSPLVVGVETAPWSTAAKTVSEWYRGVFEAAERFTIKWNEDEAKLSSTAYSLQVMSKRMGGGRATGEVEGNPTKAVRAGGATGGVEGKPWWTKVGRRLQTEQQGTRPTSRWNIFILLALYTF